MMKRFPTLILILLSAFIYNACTPEETQSPVNGAATSEEGEVLISEVLTGVAGDNNRDFVELANDNDRPVDLNGWSLSYRLSSGLEDEVVFVWDSATLIPPHGHYLLAREGVDIGVEADAYFDCGLNTSGGGLALRDASGEMVDALAWGNAPTAFTEGAAALQPESGYSIERSPGGEAGNGTDTDDNQADFRISQSPNPQNTGSAPTPMQAAWLQLVLDGPSEGEPGSALEFILTVVNTASQPVTDASIWLPVPAAFSIESYSESLELMTEGFNWTIPEIGSGDSLSAELVLRAPWTYTTASTSNYYAVDSRGSQWAFGPPLWTQIEGGIIPIGTARTLNGIELTVEGIVTMYTGGFFAGGGNTKFYIEDETGGLQVQVFGGGGVVDTPLGARVRVRGEMGAYRGSLQIVPGIVPDDVEIIAPAATETNWEPTNVSIGTALSDNETRPGRLISVEGVATRAEEFTYSYEIDLTNAEGQLITLYVDKLTNANIETIEVGRIYRAAGILEGRDGVLHLYPRLQADLIEVIPLALILETDVPNAVSPGETFTTTLTAFNHTDATLTGFEIRAALPEAGAQLVSVSETGVVLDNELLWQIGELAGEGESVAVSFEMQATSGADQIVTSDYSVTATEWFEAVSGQPLRTFVGTGVPIWAIQGAGFSSPYVRDQVTTSGFVTGIFTDLGGFWIQELESDDDPLTSSGLFIAIGESIVEIAIGDHLQVSGKVREPSQHTQLQIESAEDIKILSTDVALPEAVELDPPVDDSASLAYYESSEGMLVQISGQAVAVSPTTRYGEYGLVLPRHGLERIMRGDSAGMVILVDDGSSSVHTDRTTLKYVVASGDTVSKLVGPLAYTFGQYKIEPIDTPEVISSVSELPSLPPLGADEYSLMSWNVENLFDILEPHPSDPPRPNLAAYRLSLTKVANTILAAGAPTIVALQEVENIGILEDLATHDLLAEYAYVPALIEGTDGRGIDNGYLVRGDQATIRNVSQHVAPEGLTSRPPLLIEVEINIGAESLTVFATNNHFSSLAGGEAATEPRRAGQAAWNVAVIEGILSEEPNANVVVMGDLNSFYESYPIDILRDDGLRHVFEILPAQERYTYIFEGVSQVLDHILVTPNMMDTLRRVEILRVNADFPMPEPGDESPRRKSDHDPVIAIFGLG